ncbi:MAG: hypothetical protein A2Z95_07920 [Gallionellales bacterium GWA2_60_18]|nr:MAG: hypothetical protein A2Z95_07920 [Gallionellales bacterium GWA2_60_18]
MGLDITERNKALAVLERHKLVLETALDGFWVTDERGFLEEVNEAYAGMSGYTAQELAGMHISQLEAQERPEDTKAHIETIISQGYDRFETRHRRKDGSVMDVEISTSFMPEHRKFFVFCRDITQRKLADLELRHNQELLIEAQRLGRLGSWELDLLSGELRWSDENYRIFEVDPVVKTLTYEMFLGTVHPDDRDKVDRAYSQSLLDRQPYDVVHRLLFAGGRIKWVHEHCDTVFDVSGKPLRSVGMTQDITEQKLNEEALRVAAITFETHDAIMITDAEANIIRVNRAFSEITGYLPEEVLGQNPRMMNSGRHDRAFYIEMWQQLTHIGTWSGEVWDRRKNGEVYPKWLTITAIRDERGETSRYVAIFSDITERKQAEEEIRNLAFYDPLTSLPNRRLFMERLRAALPASARHRDYGAVMFLDMDKFKLLNDTLGHHCGDLMLVEVAKRIKSCVREMDTVARLGGDEFTVLIEGMANDEQDASRKAGTVAEKIREALAHPYRLGEHEYHSTPSIGIALFQGNADTLDMLLKHADMAMYQAKGGGRNTVRFFDPVMQGNAERRDALESDLRLAVGRNELRLYYQVQVDNEQHPVGAEALLRWEHPGRGMMMPDQFIPVAEESALIVEIGNWVLDEACAQLARWHAAGQMGGLTLAVNVSPRQFARPDFVAQVADVIERYRIDPARLKLELTESVVSGDLVGSVDKIRALRSLGVSLSMDDFDTVYSSLYYLKQVASDQIKIHRDVVQGIASGGSDAQLVQAIVDLATDMHLDVYAEGVETEAQLDFLKQHGCMAYQGYLFGKPVPIGEFEELLGKLQE